MTWVPHHLYKERKVIRFNGLTGSFEGAEGKPGVEFDVTTGIFKVNVIVYYEYPYESNLSDPPS